MEIEEVAERVNQIARRIDDLAKADDAGRVNIEEVREWLNEISALSRRLEVVVLGRPEYRVTGLAERMEKLEDLVREIVDARKSERDKLKGIQIGLALTGVTGAGTLFTLLTQVLG